MWRWVGFNSDGGDSEISAWCGKEIFENFRIAAKAWDKDGIANAWKNIAHAPARRVRDDVTALAFTVP
ncbi:MAG: hypothetical protein ACO3JG_10520 [Luteolibacter sp.]